MATMLIMAECLSPETGSGQLRPARLTDA